MIKKNYKPATKVFDSGEPFRNVLYEFILTYWKDNFQTPTFSVIGKSLGKDPQVIKNALKGLQFQGRIIIPESENGRWRSYMPDVLYEKMKKIMKDL